MNHLDDEIGFGTRVDNIFDKMWLFYFMGCRQILTKNNSSCSLLRFALKTKVRNSKQKIDEFYD